MTEHRFTPGPWTYDPAHKEVYFDDGDVRPCVAEVNDSASEEQQDADGYLIAAAPGLYAALKAFDERGYTPEVGRKIKAALAKAEGRDR